MGPDVAPIAAPISVPPALPPDTAEPTSAPEPSPSAAPTRAFCCCGVSQAETKTAAASPNEVLSHNQISRPT
jgi:hypothetical protein